MRQLTIIGCAVFVGGGLVVGQLMAQENRDGGPAAFPAPFHVLDSSGFPMFQIREDNGNPVMELIGKRGQAIRLTASGDGAAVTVVRSASQFVRMEINADKSNFLVRSGEQIVSINTAPDHQGLSMQGAKHNLIDLGLTEGKSAALTVYNSLGKIGAQIGSDYNSGGGTVVVADARGEVTGYMMSDADTEATIGVQINGTAVATISTNSQSDGGRVTVFDTSGNVKFAGGMTTDGDGGACISTSRGDRCIDGGFRMFP